MDDRIFRYYISVTTSLHPLGPFIASCTLSWYLRLQFKLVYSDIIAC